MYFRSDSQEEAINECLNYQASDPLNYTELTYAKSEWDNIPIILTRFIMYLSRNLEALSHKCKNKFSEETTESLRYDIEGQLNEITDSLDSVKLTVEQKEQSMNAKIQKLTETVDALRQQFETYHTTLKADAEETMADYIPVPKPE